jgi:hypothetical protein
MPNHSSTFSEQLNKLNKSTHLKLLKNNFNIEKNLNKISKLEELLLMKFYHTVCNIIWALNTRVMKISEMNKMMNKENKMNKNNKHQNKRNQNQKEKMLNQLLVTRQNQKKNLNAKTND